MWHTVFYNCGAYGPLILYILSCYFLWYKKTLFFYYNIGFFIDNIINIILKGIFQEPRPSIDTNQFNLAIKNGKRFVFKDGVPFDLFGMPSGHSESSLFSTAFIYFSLKDTRILYLYLLISFITMSQRVYYKFHSILQVVIGAFIGVIFASYIYSLAQYKLSK